MSVHKLGIAIYGIFLLLAIIGLLLIPSQVAVKGSGASHHNAVRGDFFPKILLVSVLIASILGVIDEFIKDKKATSPGRVGFGDLRNLIYAALAVSSFVITFPFLGFVVGSLIHIPLLLVLFGVRKYVWMAVITVIFIVLIYSMFTFLLHITLPTFILF